MLGTELRSSEDQQVLLITELYQQIFFFYFKIACICCVHLCVLVYMCGAGGGGRVQKRVSHSMELDLQTVVSCHMDAGNQTLFLCKSSEPFYH